jgi:Fe-S cluster biogenesis protein NfuA/nitrite reductase/ring-hydroxylating ferredoxin subunit
MEQLSVREASERIETLLDELGQGAPPPVMERVEELLNNVMALYGAGRERVLETAGPDLVRRLADDEIVGNLLVLHDLHPDDVDTRVQRALDQVRPYLGSHAGGVTLSQVDEAGVVHLQLEGSCDGCPSSALTVAGAIEEAIAMLAPDVVAVETEGVVRSEPALLQIQPFTPSEQAREWQHLDLDVPPRVMTSLDVTGGPLLVANLDGTLVAYLDHCPGCTARPSDGSLTGDTVTCGGCGSAYDLRLAGRGRSVEGHLSPVPLLPEHGAWKVSLPGAVGA